MTDLPSQPPATQLRHWLDDEGIWWRRIGNELLGWKAVRKLIQDDSVQVVLFYWPQPPQLIAPQDRAALWTRVEPVLRGRGEVPYQDFQAVRFRDDQGRVLLAIQEYC